MPTARPELIYSVITKPKAQLLSALANTVNSAVAQYSSDERAIIFCRSRADTVTVADIFGVKPVYAGHEDNHQTFDDWVSGTNKVMVTSPLLGCGIDIKGVRHCFHYDLAHTPIDQYQEESRAGRDGRPSYAITFVPENRPALQAKPGHDLGQSILVPWAQDNQSCRRLPGGFYLDGIAVTCISLAGAQFCDNCQRQASESPPLVPPFMPKNPHHIDSQQPANTTVSHRQLPTGALAISADVSGSSRKSQ
jgi:hypothetical protein